MEVIIRCHVGIADRLMHDPVSLLCYMWSVRFVSVVFGRCESVGGDRERLVAAGSEWSGEGLLPHQQAKVSADGCVRGTQRPHYYFRYMHCCFKYTKLIDSNDPYFHHPFSLTCPWVKYFSTPNVIQLHVTGWTVSAGKKNKLRLYYLSWLRNKILHNDPEVEKRQGWTSVGDLEGCVHYKVGKHTLLRALWMMAHI